MREHDFETRLSLALASLGGGQGGEFVRSLVEGRDRRTADVEVAWPTPSY